ncbi:MAG: TetR/AcrR family transcriptional regulator [Thiovulaceae bacterium]|nr:TetR/AcrR family transcriptional regulator [Sulfurimonadaceae bacterium]
MSFKKKIQGLKRELLLEEAATLFIRDGYEGMKVADLSINTGVSIGAIYAMFGSKEGIYNNYILNQIEYYINLMQEEINTCSDPKEMLRIITKIKFSAIIKNKNALKESYSDPTFFLTLSLDENDPMMQMYRYIAQHVMEPLCATITTDKKPLEMVFLYDGLSFGIVKYWLVEGGDLMSTIDDTVENFLRVIRIS